MSQQAIKQKISKHLPVKHTETSSIDMKCQSMTGFYMIRALAERYFRTDFKIMFLYNTSYISIFLNFN